MTDSVSPHTSQYNPLRFNIECSASLQYVAEDLAAVKEMSIRSIKSKQSRDKE